MDKHKQLVQLVERKLLKDKKIKYLYSIVAENEISQIGISLWMKRNFSVRLPSFSIQTDI